MPALETEHRSATRSALRYRPINTDQASSAPVALRQRRSRPDTLVTSAPVPPDDINLEKEQHPPRKRRAVSPILQQRNAERSRARQRFHPLFFVGIGLLVTILLWTGITQLMVWGTNEYNTIVYGYPRTFQIDQVVGNHDSTQNPSHFIAMNLKGRIIVIEIPGGDVSKSVVFSGPTLFGPGEDLTPVTVAFQDVHHDGKPNMIISTQGSQFVFLNENGTFVPSTQSQNSM